MAYNSEVAVLFNKEAVALMPDDVRKAADKVFETVRELDDGCLLCHAYNTKWDTGLDDVGTVHTFMTDLDMEDKAGCEFLRLGDDDDDNERLSYGNPGACRLWFERHITLQGAPIVKTKEADNGEHAG